MFKTRLLSGIVLVLLLIGVVGYGGNILFGALLVISLTGMWELYRVADMERSLLSYAGYASALLYYGMLYRFGTRFMAFFLVLSLVMILGVYVFSFPKFRADQVTMAFFGVFYVAVLLSFVYQTRMFPHMGKAMVWLIFLSSWGCDTCAYCVGVLFGKHKMAPKLSPKKSVEGGIGGVAGAALLGLLYGYVTIRLGVSRVDPLHCAFICGVGGMISQIGDLAASAIKRNYEKKDYGTLIPGHGGILDRFDSVIFVAPVIFYLLVILTR